MLLTFFFWLTPLLKPLCLLAELGELGARIKLLVYLLFDHILAHNLHSQSF